MDGNTLKFPPGCHLSVEYAGTRVALVWECNDRLVAAALYDEFVEKGQSGCLRVEVVGSPVKAESAP